MKYIYILALMLTLCQCNTKESDYSPNSADKITITNIDTANIVPSLKMILMEYIKTYPKFQNLAIEGDIILKDKYHNLNVDQVYSLGPTSMMRYGEYYGDKRLFPSSYFIICNKRIFMSSSNDKLIRQDICKKVYLKHVELKNKTDFKNDVFWLIKITNDGRAFIVTKEIDKYTGIDKVKTPINWDSIIHIRRNGQSEDPEYGESHREGKGDSLQL